MVMPSASMCELFRSQLLLFAGMGTPRGLVPVAIPNQTSRRQRQTPNEEEPQTSFPPKKRHKVFFFRSIFPNRF
ncbi:hypothetical protein SETIT_8G058700v2 [Setaria italica]|uniref:Uncharacterized protein n=1 Tax=Setaria italica TaxID=4555 RepID=A0A368S4Q0_SETIT|nr:hypothetical protein SETIT_8G058700v2 [Setaria italica]RCV37389.1 hypothetical protein SETIT_8G058700v2 [Setaria italica]